MQPQPMEALLLVSAVQPTQEASLSMEPQDITFSRAAMVGYWIALPALALGMIPSICAGILLRWASAAS